MSNKLTIVFSGKKQSGKSSAAKFALASYLNHKHNKELLHVNDDGVLHNCDNVEINLDRVPSKLEPIWIEMDAKIYSFADPLKEFCINVLGLDEKQCYGSDRDKNSLTHLDWSEQFEEVRNEYARVNKRTGKRKKATGKMTAREVMQVVGTEWCRRVDENCWARATYNKISEEGYELAIIADARFPNEVTLGTERNAKVVKLTRKLFDDEHASETALDGFPLGEFTLVIDNSNQSMCEKNEFLDDHLKKWFSEVKLGH